MKYFLWLSYLPFPFLMGIFSGSSDWEKYWCFFVLLYILGLSAQMGRGSSVTCLMAAFVSLSTSLVLCRVICMEPPLFDIVLLTGLDREIYVGMKFEMVIKFLCVLSAILYGFAFLSISFDKWDRKRKKT